MDPWLHCDRWVCQRMLILLKHVSFNFSKNVIKGLHDRIRVYIRENILSISKAFNCLLRISKPRLDILVSQYLVVPNQAYHCLTGTCVLRLGWGMLLPRQRCTSLMLKSLRCSGDSPAQWSVLPETPLVPLSRNTGLPKLRSFGFYLYNFYHIFVPPVPLI